jgi:HNH endonuclease
VGGGRGALAGAGGRGGRCGKYSAERLMEILEFVWRKTRRPPTEETLHKIGRVGIGAYARIWGSHVEARARLARYRRGEISWEVMMAPVGRGGRSGAAGNAGGGRRAPLPVSLRWRVLVRDGQRCVACGASARDGAKLEVDHIVPVCRGGGDEMSNLRTLCWACNRGKGMSDVGCRMSDVKAGRGRAAQIARRGKRVA